MKKITLLLLSLAFYSCSSNEEETTPVTNTPETVEPDMYINGKISNENPFEYNYFTNNSATYFETLSTSEDEGAGENSYTYSSGLKTSVTDNNNSISITFRRLHNGTHGTETTEFPNMFSTSLYDFLEPNGYSGFIKIKYYDENGALYRSDLGDNTSNDLFISSSQHFTENGVQYVIIKGYFAGRVYKSSDPTQYKSLYAVYFKLKYHEFVE